MALFLSKKQPKNAAAIKYPTKTTLNLVIHEKTENSLSVVTPVFVVLAIAIILFTKFAVIDRYIALNKAEKTYEASVSQLHQINEKLKGYDEVARKYHIVAKEYLTQEQAILVNRIELLDLLQNDLAGIGTFETIEITRNQVTLGVKATTLDKIRALRETLLKEEYVRNVTLDNATTTKNTQTNEVVSVQAKLIIEVGNPGQPSEITEEQQPVEETEAAQ